ncbi:LRR and NB-ARC domains-containing disease resistance protein [Euphorbia peplus]|nr:LRR and NB-ARC domains-containing disease resistance protein [Euphorbia peplus]
MEATDKLKTPSGFMCRKRDSTSTHPNNKRPAFSTMGLRLLATEVVGKQFENYIKDIWSSLTDSNNVFQIGIHGTGGVGKSLVAKHINNKLLQCPNHFHHVFWLNMSPPPYTLRDLQTCISMAVGLHLSDKDDETKRAAKLSKGLAAKDKSLLILDDLWDFISLQDVGVPVGADGFTVFFTTRSLGVCRKLGCQREIEVKCLPPDESYELFRKMLGKETTLSREVEEMSRLVADKCLGLPFAITIMAREMKGVTDKHRWRNALRGKIRKKVDMEVFQKLKISYDYLNDTTLQRCFLYCASLVEVNRKKRRLAEYLVDEGLIENMNSRIEELDEALTMLDFLRDAGLLDITSSNSVNMNKLIQSMALQMMEENQHGALIKNNMSLTDLPDDKSWTEDLVRVTLEKNEIENIPSNFSPSCSKLSTLVLTRNYKLRCIGDSFFEGMPRLKVLDLSHTKIESLPQSVFSLVNLTTLLLAWCRKLKKIPSVAALKALKKLDLSFSVVEEVPGDIERLSKLTYLDLTWTEIKELNSEIFAKLSNLQFLKLPWSVTVNGEVFARLGRLETLTCCFNNVVELNNYLIPLKGGFNKREPPLQLHVQVGRGSRCCAYQLLYDGDDGFAEIDDDRSKVALYMSDINESGLWNYFQDILIEKCNGARSLCNFFPIKGATELKHFSVQKCDKLEFLCSGGQGMLENIEYLELCFLEKLGVLVRKEGDLPYGGSCFSNLTRFLVQGCPNMKLLLPMHLMPNLKNLQRLYIIDCPLMGEIFGAEVKEEQSKMVEKKICSLPKLSLLWLTKLPMLERVCGGGTVCLLPKPCSIKTRWCPKFMTDAVGVYDIAQS